MHLLRRMKIGLFLILFSSQAQATTNDYPIPLNSLLRDFRSRMVKCGPDCPYLFHWESRKNPFAVGKTTKQLIKDESESAYKNNFNRGLYLASDPVVSRSYGDRLYGDDWRLIEVQFPQGTKILDLVDQKFRKYLLEKYSDPADSRNQECIDRILNAVNEDATICGKLRTELFKRLAPAAVRYEWMESNLTCPGTSNSTGDNGAFLMLESRWLDSKETVLKSFDKDSLEDKAERAQIQNTLIRAFQGKRAQQDSFSKALSKSLWQDIPFSSQVPESNDRWMKAHLLKCREQMWQRKNVPKDEAIELPEEIGPAN